MTRFEALSSAKAEGSNQPVRYSEDSPQESMSVQGEQPGTRQTGGASIAKLPADIDGAAKQHRYRVAEGDTLSHISQKLLGQEASMRDVYNFVKVIARANKIGNPDEIYDGQWLTIPREQEDGGKYEVAKGDTLSRISRRLLGKDASLREIYNFVNEIARANNIANPDRIYTGQLLIIPERARTIDRGQSAAVTGVGAQPGGKAAGVSSRAPAQESGSPAAGQQSGKGLDANENKVVPPGEINSSLEQKSGENGVDQPLATTAATESSQPGKSAIDRNALEKDAEAIRAATGNDRFFAGRTAMQYAESCRGKARRNAGSSTRSTKRSSSSRSMKKCAHSWTEHNWLGSRRRSTRKTTAWKARTPGASTPRSSSAVNGEGAAIPRLRKIFVTHCARIMPSKSPVSTANTRELTDRT